MKVINETTWDTRTMRSIILRVAKQRVPEKFHNPYSWADPNRRSLLKSLRVTIRYHKTTSLMKGWVSGRGALNGTRMRLTVPRVAWEPWPGMPRTFGLQFAMTVAHEFDHLRGLKHREMVEPRESQYEWARNIEIRRREAPKLDRVAVLAGRREARLKTAEARVLEWTRRSKLAATKLAKWKRTLRRIQKTVAVAANTVKED